MMKPEMKKLAVMLMPNEINPLHNGNQFRYHFDNGYSASVICHEFSYGYEEGLLELAVLKDKKLCYTTSITDDVLGRITAEEAVKVLNEIKGLEK